MVSGIRACAGGQLCASQRVHFIGMDLQLEAHFLCPGQIVFRIFNAEHALFAEDIGKLCLSLLLDHRHYVL